MKEEVEISIEIVRLLDFRPKTFDKIQMKLFSKLTLNNNFLYNIQKFRVNTSNIHCFRQKPLIDSFIVVAKQRYVIFQWKIIRNLF